MKWSYFQVTFLSLYYLPNAWTTRCNTGLTSSFTEFKPRSVNAHTLSSLIQLPEHMLNDFLSPPDLLNTFAYVWFLTLSYFTSFLSNKFTWKWTFSRLYAGKWEKCTTLDIQFLSCVCEVTCNLIPFEFVYQCNRVLKRLTKMPSWLSSAEMALKLITN